jgi:hypothetical protein
MADPLTRPERAAEIALERRRMGQIAKDPCAHCKHREIEHGRAQCPTVGRYWPRCNNTHGLAFELDPTTLRGEQP